MPLPPHCQMVVSAAADMALERDPRMLLRHLAACRNEWECPDKAECHAACQALEGAMRPTVQASPAA